MAAQPSKENRRGREGGCDCVWSSARECVCLSPLGLSCGVRVGCTCVCACVCACVRMCVCTRLWPQGVSVMALRSSWVQDMQLRLLTCRLTSSQMD